MNGSSPPPLILNVDDNPTARYARTLVLRDAGFEVAEAESGRAALQKVDELLPDLVLLDVRLPDIDGIEVCRRIKRAHPTLPVLQTSAVFIEPDARARGIEGGADRYLAQPFEPEELIGAVRGLLRLRHAEAAVRENEARLRITFDCAPVGIGEGDLDGRILRVNDRFCDITGYSRDELLRLRFRDITHPDDVAAGESEYRRLHAGEIPLYRVEKRYVRKDGGIVWVSLVGNLVRDAEGRPLYGVGIVEDITERRRAAEEIRRSEERFRAIVESATDYAIVTTDLEGQVTSWNPGAERMFGYGQAEMLGRDARVIFTPEDVDAGVPEREMEAALESGRGTDERWHARRDGTRFWATGIVMPLREGGGIGGFLKILRDRTDEREAADRHREAEARFRATFEQAAVGMAHVGLDGRWLRVNGKLCEIVGYTRGELLDLTFQDITHPDDLESDLANLRALLAGEIETYSMEKRYLRKDGPVVWVDLTVSLLRDGSGRPERLIAVVEDITERQRMSEALRDGEARYRAVIETAVDAIVIIDERGTIQSFNPSAEAMFGYPAAEAVGRNVKLLMAPSDAEAHDDHLEAYRRTGVRRIIGVRREVEGRRRDGSTFPLDLSVAEWRAADGARFFIGVLRDISRRKRAEDALLRLNEELERRIDERTSALMESEAARRRAEHMETLGQMTGSVAHDINNVLTVVLGSLGMIEGRLAGGPARVLPLVEAATKAAEKGERMAQDLLAFARKQRLEPAALDINAVILGVEDILRGLLPPEIALRLILAPGLPPAYADQNQLERAVLNLVSNARDAMAGRSGTITVETGTDGPPTSPGPAQDASGPQLLLTVRDEGAGMPDEVREHAFEPFFTTKSAGTGLGLSQVYGFARQSHGKVTIDSREGAGTAVTIALPQAEDASPPASG